MTGGELPSATGGRRIGWPAVPAHVRAGVERLLGGPVVGAVSQPGGFSDGVAVRVRLANGGRAFVKAASSLTAPSVAAFHRRELTVSRRLPEAVPAAKLLAGYDDGDWVALLFEEIPGRLPTQPWRPEELDRVLVAVTELAALLTPSPIERALLGGPRLGGWPELAADAVAVQKLHRLSPWAGARLDELIALESRAALVLAGDTLLHGDLYPFNLLLTADRVFVIDWPHAWIGAAHCDVVMLLSGTALSGIDPQPIAETHPLTRDLTADQIDVVLAMHAGFLLRIATTAGPGADRALIEMMVALGLGSLNWLRART